MPSQVGMQAFADNITQAKTNRVSVYYADTSIIANYCECYRHQNNDWSEWLYGSDKSITNELCVRQSPEIKSSILELITICV